MSIRRRWTDAAIALACLWVTVAICAQRAGSDSGVWHRGWVWGRGHMVFGSSMMLLAILAADELAERTRVIASESVFRGDPAGDH